MIFDKSRVYTALNADELKAGDKVIVADTLSYLHRKVADGSDIEVLKAIRDDNCTARFGVEGGCFDLLAYLVERAENCTKCKKNHNLYGGCEHLEAFFDDEEIQKTLVCSEFVKAEPKTEKHYRPFRDTDELVKVWGEKIGMSSYWGTDEDLTIPNICVASRNVHEYVPWRFIITGFGWKDVNKDGKRITKPTVYIADEELTLEQLFCQYTFLDGSTCGVEE